MSLINKNTKWVLFLSASHANPEERHIIDLVFGLMCLEKAGVNTCDICIYVDGKDRTKIANLFSIASATVYNIKEPRDFFVDLKSNSYERLMMFVTGHGNEIGIDAVPPVSPHFLIQSLKKAPKLDQAVVYLGQCYAGIFNYMRAGCNQSGKQPDANIILIGATELQESLSTATAEEFPMNNNISWIANVFLLHVFKWFSAPLDVDGDKLYTIMDSYKYAGVMTNRTHKNIKANAFIELMDCYEVLKEAKKMVKNKTGDLQIDQQNTLRLKAIGNKYMQSSYINNVHQECWVLNSIPAQSIKI